MNTGTGWQVPCRHASIDITTIHRGCRGMDDMLSPRATSLHVNASCGIPDIDELPCNPHGYMPKGRVPVITHHVLIDAFNSIETINLHDLDEMSKIV